MRGILLWRNQKHGIKIQKQKQTTKKEKKQQQKNT